MLLVCDVVVTRNQCVCLILVNVMYSYSVNVSIYTKYYCTLLSIVCIVHVIITCVSYFLSIKVIPLCNTYDHYRKFLHSGHIRWLYTCAVHLSVFQAGSNAYRQVPMRIVG